MVVDSHYAVERISEGPVESGSESDLLSFKRFDGWADLKISGPAALDGDSQSPLAEKHIVAVLFCDVAHREVVLDVVFEEVPALLTDALHDCPLGEDDRAAFRALPEFRACQPFADEGRAKVVQQLGAKLVAVGRWNGSELRQCLGKGWRQRRYPSGGSNSDGTASG